MPPATYELLTPSMVHRARPGPFEFTSSVAADLRKDLEALYEEHRQRPSLITSVQDCVEEFGKPEVLRRGDRIQWVIPKNGAQSLFACHNARRPGVPVGAAVYLRTSVELLRILHLIVHPGYLEGGRHARLDLSLQLISEVCNLSSRIAGIRRVQLPYQRDAFVDVPRLGAAR
jgi:hypothetical protein